MDDATGNRRRDGAGNRQGDERATGAFTSGVKSGSSTGTPGLCDRKSVNKRALISNYRADPNAR